MYTPTEDCAIQLLQYHPDMESQMGLMSVYKLLLPESFQNIMIWQVFWLAPPLMPSHPTFKVSPKVLLAQTDNGF